jgi:MinD superfamily P-loop ATPase
MSTIAVASGKGGTGKTTIATSLALAAADLHPVFLDCDVEAPNAHLFLHPAFDDECQVTLPVPRVEEVRCSGCGICAQVCQYGAILVLGGRVQIFPELCHGCGSCSRQCPEHAIDEVDRHIGRLQAGITPGGLSFRRGILDIGEAMPVPVIRALKKWPVEGRDQLVIRDSPPGTSCPVVETLRGADFVLLVTEPTPFGLHDLELALEVAQSLALPTGVIINRSGVGDSGVEAVCRDRRIPVMMRIPLSRQIGEALARGQPLIEAFPEYRQPFRELLESILHGVDSDFTDPEPLPFRNRLHAPSPEQE